MRRVVFLLAAGLRAEVRFDAVDFFLRVVLRAVDLRPVDLRAAVLRFLVAAAFLPAATRFVLFLRVDFFAVVVLRFLVAAAFLPAAEGVARVRVPGAPPGV